MLEGLSNGIGIVIDNDIDTENDIKEIINKIEAKGIPIFKFDSIKKAKAFLPNFKGINFIILDWKMNTSIVDYENDIIPGSAPELEEANIKDAIDFIKGLKEICFAPLFIFTNETDSYINETIIPRLSENGLYFNKDETKNFIYIKNKNALLKGDIIQDTAEWISKTPSIYFLKIWENALFKAKNEVFWNLYSNSSGRWPKILWESFEKDGDNPRSGINEILFQLIIASVDLSAIEKDKILAGSAYDIKEFKQLFRHTMYYFGKDATNKPGDIYKKDNKYYLNIRAECDTMPRNGEQNIDIYLIEGAKVTGKDLTDMSYSPETGIHENINECFILLLEDDVDIIRFNLKKLKVVGATEWSTYKRCRLLPPYITHIQQRYSVYLSRIGKPKLPQEIIDNFWPQEVSDLASPGEPIKKA